MSNIHALEPQAYGYITFKTTFGDLDIELFTKQCPKITQNFVQLCLDGYYEGTIFERVEKDFIAIGGCHCDNDDDLGEYFPDEFHSRLRFTRRGLLATANTSKNENGPKFFFTLGATPELQNKHTIFGRLVGKSIYSLVDLNECHVDEEDKPIRTQTIKEVVVKDNPFPDLKPRASKPRGTQHDMGETSTSDNLYDPLNKPKRGKSKKLSFHCDDDSDDSGEDWSNQSVKKPKMKNDDLKKSNTDQVKPESPQDAANKSLEHHDSKSIHDSSNHMQTEDDKIRAKEKRLKEIRAQIQTLKEQIERGNDHRGKPEITNERIEDDFATGMSSPSASTTGDSLKHRSKRKDGKSRERETIEIVTNFQKKLKEASKNFRDPQEKPSKKKNVEENIHVDDFAGLDTLDDDAWMTHKFEVDD